jgi:hypothetical protein
VVQVRTPKDAADAVASLAKGPAMGGVENLAAEITGPTVSLNFDARYAQLQEFLSRLGTLMGPFEVRSVDIAQAPGARPMRVRVVLLFPGLIPQAHQPETRLVADASPPKRRQPPVRRPVEPVGPDPVVHTILFSSQQKAALVDVSIVRAGDRVGWGTVRSIEADAVILVSDAGRVKRLALEEPRFRATKK